jgi:hypothetical protein
MERNGLIIKLSHAHVIDASKSNMHSTLSFCPDLTAKMMDQPHTPITQIGQFQS